MLGASSALTLVTVAGLVAGLAREWLLVADWGAGARTDAFLVALFLPEAVRMTLSVGLLSSATLAPWQGWSRAQRQQRLSQLTWGLLGLGLVLALACVVLRLPLLRLIGPGLEAAHLAQASQALVWLAWSLPALLLQAWWAVPLHAQGRYLLAGAASLAYNLPGVACLAWMGPQATEAAVGASFVLGAVASAALLLPSALRAGLRLHWQGSWGAMRELGHRVAPLLGSALLGQGVTLLERIVASYLGEGVITVLNLARKLANLPLVALAAVSQVVLGLMSRGASTEREALLRQGLAVSTLITLPAALGLLMAAPAIVVLLFPGVAGTDRLAPLLGWYAVALVVGGWNAMLTRYSHAAGNTRLPFFCDLAGSGVQALALPLLAWAVGIAGLAMATLVGVLITGAMLMHRNRLWPHAMLERLVPVSALPLLVGGLLLPSLPALPWPRLGWAALAGLACLALAALVLKPWQRTPESPV